ncbi:MAG: DUF5723 family protein, partial [Lentimicrobiaceae bacterium]|nr:DUF5723 family protein [Lentimicrobiaceae bacterium]
GDIFYITDGLLDKMNQNSAIRGWGQCDVINFGFRTNKKNYFTISATVKADANVIFQKDLFGLIIEGNNRPENENLSFVKNNFISMTSYVEFGLGYNREFNENASFGVSAKYLSGLANAYTKKSDLYLTTGENYHELILNQNIQGYFSAVSDIDVERDENGNIKYDEEGKVRFKKLSSFSDMMRNLKNHGFSLDVGGRYKINDFFEISASVLDIGFIKWQTYTKQYDVSDKPFSFNGYKTEESIFEESDKTYKDKIEEYFKKLGDSLVNHFASEIEPTSSYTKMLNTRFNVGFSIYASSDDRFNLNFRGIFINGVFAPSGSVSYHRNVGKWFDFVVGNTFKPNALLNPGLGVNFTLSVFQLYAAVDYTNTLLYIDRAKNLNVAVGINFVAPLGNAFKASYLY